MAFVLKKDYCGLAIQNVLVCASAAKGETTSDVQAADEYGTVIAHTNVYGGASPTNSYDLKADATFQGETVIKLGKPTQVDAEKFMLVAVNITTQAGASPTISAQAARVEDDAAGGWFYYVPVFTLAKSHNARLLFSECSASAEGVKLQSSTYAMTATGNVGRDEFGNAISSSVTGGMVTATLTFIQTGEAVPSVTPNTQDGWHISGALTQTNPKGGYPTWQCVLTKYLDKIETV